MKSILILLSLFTAVTYAAQSEKEGTVTLGNRVRSNSGHIYTLDAPSIEEMGRGTFGRGSQVKFVAQEATATVTDVVEEGEEQGHVPASTPVIAPRPELETSLPADDESYEEVRRLVSFKDWKMSAEQRGKEIAHGCNLSLTYPEVDPDSWSAGHIGSFLINNNWITSASASNFAHDPRVIIILKLRGRTDLHRTTTGKRGLFQEMRRNNVITDGEARLMGYATGDL